MPFLLITLLGVAFTATSPPQADTVRSDRRTAYVMDVRLDPATRTVSGTEHLTWRNPANHSVDELQFHMYLNAFRNEQSTFMRESGGRHRGYAVDSTAWGGITVERLQIQGGPDLTGGLRFIQPDDNNEDDRTVAALDLPEPVPAGGSITLEIDFTARLPKIFARTGWERKSDGTLFFMVAQWFPKLGVFEVPGQRYVPEDAERGQWSTHQFHANSEFYADFGTYEVTMTVPENYVVGAVGTRTGETASDSTRTLTYRAEDVHDFAWTASPAFRTYMDRWKDVDLRLLLQPEHTGQVRRHFEAAKTALQYFDDWVGPYPYDTLTLVDGIGGSNGMEYPTLITLGTTYMLPPWLRLLELVTIHEFGHQYFYGLLASNEAEEAWLDEGINSYLEARVMNDAYGPGSVIDVPGLRIGGFEMHHYNYAEPAPPRRPIQQRSWEYGSGYGIASYSKPATVLNTLERHLGWPVMQQILQTYYQRWRFRHPTTRDFIETAEDVAGEDLSWFFDQFIYGTAVVDYAVTDIDIDTLSAEADSYRSTVRVRRVQDGFFPIDLQVRYADGASETRSWNGRETNETFAFEGPTPVVEAYLDPDRVVWLETDRLNNRRVLQPENRLARKAQFKVTVWIQLLFSLLTGLF